MIWDWRRILLDVGFALLVLCGRDLAGGVAPLEDTERVISVQPQP